MLIAINFQICCNFGLHLQSFDFLIAVKFRHNLQACNANSMA